MSIKVSDYIVETLYKRGTRVFFGYQGGNISHLIDSIGNNKNVEFVETCHEQAAAFAANAYAQISGNIGVALASSGPGSINLINGIANAYCDSIPCIFFTGDVNTTAKNKGNGRQNAFQEIDIIPLVKSITKYSVSIKLPEEICDELEKAMDAAVSGRPGPVVINLPHDIQRSQIDVSEIKIESVIHESADIEKYATETMEYLQEASKPLFLIGGGLRTEERRFIFNSILDRTNIPVVTSLLGLDIVSHDHPNYRGIIGDYGDSSANNVICEADCVIVLGNRLDDRQISVSLAKKLDNTKFIHIDIDSTELGHKLIDERKIECDLDLFLPILSKYITKKSKHEKWFKETAELFNKEKKQSRYEFHPNGFISEVSMRCKSIYAFDVGNNQMHSMQSLFVKSGTRVLTSGGLGSMGYSLPAAIGASFADRKNRIFSICGDGGIQMNIQELQTISYYNLPINIILLNNSGLGMIYDLQNKLFEGRHTGTTENYGVPDFEKVAKAYGFDYVKVEKESDYKYAVDKLINGIQVFVEYKFNIDTPVSNKL